MTSEQLGNVGLKTMAFDFPVINVPVVASDNKFPALGWLIYAFKNMIERFTELGNWLI